MPGKIIACGLAIMMVAVPPAVHASDGAALVARITERIEAETNCRVDYVSQLRDLRTASPPRVEARVHCRDGTAYDVDWDLGSNRFRFEPCADERAVCQGLQ